MTKKIDVSGPIFIIKKINNFIYTTSVKFSIAFELYYETFGISLINK